MKFILIAIAIFIIYRIIKTQMSPPGRPGRDTEEGGAAKTSGKASGTSDPPEKEEDTVTVYDEVCSTYLLLSKAVSDEGKDGKTHYFCSEECHQTFLLAEQAEG